MLGTVLRYCCNIHPYHTVWCARVEQGVAASYIVLIGANKKITLDPQKKLVVVVGGDGEKWPARAAALLEAGAARAPLLVVGGLGHGDPKGAVIRQAAASQYHAHIAVYVRARLFWLPA